MSEKLVKAKEIGKKLLDFLRVTPSPYHVVDLCQERLHKYGFTRISEKEAWKELKPNGKYYFTRNNSSIVAFAIGGQYKAGNGCKIIGAHTDSPNLRVKPVSNVTSNGIDQISVVTYGGGLWHTWFDRDLTIAGRVFVKSENGVESRIVNLEHPVAKVPNLAIHLTALDERGKFNPNTERHICPVICSETVRQLQGTEKQTSAHNPLLLGAIAKALNVPKDDIVDFDLSLADVQPPQFVGIEGEFISSPRLDNLASCFCSLEALLAVDDTLDSDDQVRVCALYDHEEVGSNSICGAACSHLEDMITRIVHNLGSGGAELPLVVRSNSFLISADMAHGVHPNYPEKHHSLHRIELHKGVVIKYNANQRYATSDLTSAAIQYLAGKHSIPLQKFCVANDSPCGSTIGPSMSTRTGIPTIDIGISQWSMHSIRETCSTIDVEHYLELMTAFYRDFKSSQIKNGE